MEFNCPDGKILIKKEPVRISVPRFTPRLPYHIMCMARNYPHSPHRRDSNFRGRGGGGLGGSVRAKNVKKCVKRYWNFQRGWRGGGGGWGLRKKRLKVDKSNFVLLIITLF